MDIAPHMFKVKWKCETDDRASGRAREREKKERLTLLKYSCNKVWANMYPCTRRHSICWYFSILFHFMTALVCCSLYSCIGAQTVFFLLFFSIPLYACICEYVRWYALNPNFSLNWPIRSCSTICFRCVRRMKLGFVSRRKNILKI